MTQTDTENTKPIQDINQLLSSFEPAQGFSVRCVLRLYHMPFKSIIYKCETMDDLL